MGACCLRDPINGIPRHLREACWFHYSGAEKYLANNPGLYSMLVYREMQDRQMGFTKERNKILEFIDVLERENILFNEKSGMSSAPSGDNLDDNPTSPSSPVAPIVTPHVHSLRRLLVAFAYYSWPHPDDSRTPPKQCSYRIGYCQSLNFVAGLILLIFLPNPNDPPNVNSPLSPTSVKSSRPASSTVFRNPEEIEEETRLLAEERAFWMLVATVERLLPPEMYGSNLEGAQVAQEVLWKWLLGERGKRFGVGKMADWVETMEGGEPTGIRKSRSRRGGGAGTSSGNGMPPLSLVTTSWFMTVFINVLPIETVLRVWDCFTYQGEKVLMRVTLTLLKIHEDEVLACNDTTDAWRLIKEIPPRMIDAHKLMDICFKPRVNLSLFDSESSSSLLHIGSPSMSRQSSDAHLHDSDDDYDGRSSVGSIHPRSTVGGALQIQNDPLRKWGSSTLSSGGKVSGGGKVPKRGVGSVSTKMIEHYRALALQERRSK
ncbi:rab-GTPase-TBC domain-containing protein [Chytriomyces sp. MP71]|nr:rab-GTPase-TBC domain-containing protein [Chytriomyces sp. MP71]